ncbi:MAG TPA: tRNA (guanosine(37)-N1)-methyltransferase TrmD [Candidatus Koribacter sp.]
MKIDLITIFPEFFRGPLEHGIVNRAQKAGLVEIAVRDLREFTHDRHRTVDDRPFGGGEGMVLKPEPIFECLEAIEIAPKGNRENTQVLVLSPQGRLFDQRMALELSKLDRLVLISGRYEGIDERVTEVLADSEVSVGDFVLSGGELGAAIIMDAVTRLLPGALGNADSARQESFTAGEKEIGEGPDSTCASGGLLDYPHYTRPAEWQGHVVPEVLQNGNHLEIQRWRRKRALEKTFKNRPDLLEGAELSKEDQKYLAELRAAKV